MKEGEKHKKYELTWQQKRLARSHSTAYVRVLWQNLFLARKPRTGFEKPLKVEILPRMQLSSENAKIAILRNRLAQNLGRALENEFVRALNPFCNDTVHYLEMWMTLNLTICNLPNATRLIQEKGLI